MFPLPWKRTTPGTGHLELLRAALVPPQEAVGPSRLSPLLGALGTGRHVGPSVLPKRDFLPGEGVPAAASPCLLGNGRPGVRGAGLRWGAELARQAPGLGVRSLCCKLLA